MADSTAALDAIVKESQKFPLASALAKQEILQTLVANARSIGGGDDAGAHELTKHLLTALKTYPGVTGPLKAAKKLPVNLQLLELTASG